LKKCVHHHSSDTDEGQRENKILNFNLKILSTSFFYAKTIIERVAIFSYFVSVERINILNINTLIL